MNAFYHISLPPPLRKFFVLESFRIDCLPEDVVVGEMETDSGQVTEMPALDCSEGGDDEDARAEVLETVTGALDLPGAATNTAADTGAEESSIQEPSSSTGGQRKESYC